MIVMVSIVIILEWINMALLLATAEEAAIAARHNNKEAKSKSPKSFNREIEEELKNISLRSLKKTTTSFTVHPTRNINELRRLLRGSFLLCVLLFAKAISMCDRKAGKLRDDGSPIPKMRSLSFMQELGMEANNMKAKLDPLTQDDRKVKMNSLVRRWLQEDKQEITKVMNWWRLKFDDVFVEEQFAYFYLYKHIDYMRRTIVLLFGGVLITLTYTEFFSMRIPVSFFPPLPSSLPP
jgi:hypothetical protein